MEVQYMYAVFFSLKRRLVIFFAVVFFLLGAVLFRLGYVQFFMGDMLTKRAEDSWSRDVPFEAQRGDILDVNGVKLATNQTAPTVFVVPRQVENSILTAKKLSEILNVPEQQIYKQITKNSSIERINPGGRKISVELANQVRDLDLKGVFVAEDSKRYYPFGKYLSHVLGFAGIDNQGLNGLELYYDRHLSGQAGRVSFFSDAKGKRLPNLADQYVQATDGADLQLTIDARIQTIVEREMELAEERYHPDSMIAIAMNPKNGEILAMSSRPSFDPGDYKNVDPLIYNRNLPVWSSYEPGSTFKIITLASALEEDMVDLEAEQFHDHGSVEVDGARLKCWKAGGHGTQTFLEVVQNSCNPGFVELGQRLGKEKLFSYIEKFGFGSKTGIDLAGEATGILFSLDKVGPVELATTAFGQGVSVTPIQQIAAVSAAINGGKLYTPKIAKQLVDSESGKILQKFPTEMKRQVISEKTSKKVRLALETVVAQGSGKGAFVDGFRVGGKTGTAQKVKNGVYMQGNYILSFIGFAPANDPQIIVYVAVDNPKDTVQFGGTVSAPIVGNILRDAQKVLQIPSVKNQVEKEYKPWLDPKPIEVPNFVGMKKSEVLTQLIDLNVEAEGEGELVFAQSPKAGTKLDAGSTVRLYFIDEKEKAKKK